MAYSNRMSNIGKSRHCAHRDENDRSTCMGIFDSLLDEKTDLHYRCRIT